MCERRYFHEESALYQSEAGGNQQRTSVLGEREGNLPLNVLSTIRIGVLLIALTMALPQALVAGGIGGRVTYRGSGVEGVYVEVFDRDPAIASSPVGSTNSGDGGSFSLDLPVGKYFVTARKRPGAGSSAGMLFGASGSEPLQVSGDGTSAVTIILKESGAGAGPGEGGTHVSGRVVSRGSPVAGAFVYFYPGTEHRGPGYAARARTDALGVYQAGLSPGSYTVTVRSGKGGDGMGTVDREDLVGEHPGVIRVSASPVRVEDIPLRQVDRAAWQERRWGQAQGNYELEGVVSDDTGRPVPGLYAFAYADYRMVGKPDAISPPTGPDGRFRLAVPGPGTYYLGARSRYGGPVEPGELMGSCDADGVRSLELDENHKRVLCDFPVREVW